MSVQRSQFDEAEAQGYFDLDRCIRGPMRLAQQVTDNGYQCQHPICVAGYVYLAGHRGGLETPWFLDAATFADGCAVAKLRRFFTFAGTVDPVAAQQQNHVVISHA